MMVNYNHRIISVLICLFIFSSLSSCAPSPLRTGPGALKQRPQPTINSSSLEQRIHLLINNERRKQGLTQLEWDDRLAGIGRKHSRDMAKRNYFDHYSPEGHDFSYRYQQEGYSCAIRIGHTIHTGAENIALNHLYDSVTTVNNEAFYDWNSQEKIAETTVQGWMKSPGHRKNILTPHWRHEGIGISISPDDRVYITQNFC
jgi:uncharacterized protein YkwD